LVNSFVMLLDMPAVPAIISALIECPAGIEEASLIQAEGGRRTLEEALSVLSRHGLVTRRSGCVCLAPGSDALNKALKIIAVFQELRLLTEISFMIRGVLGATEYFECLVHRETMFSLLTGEDITREMLEKVLAAEERQGYVEKLDIAYHVRGNLREKFFPFIPRHHYDDFVFMHSREGQRSHGGPGDSVVQESYLLSHHPASLAEQARRYMKEHKPHIVDRVRNEAFDIIWWFDSD
jgi:hypothetical protein